MKSTNALDLNDSKTRERLARQYQPLLHKIANQMVLKIPPEMSFDDVLGYGNEGIVYAMNTYKDNLGQSFQQYLGWCIRNKILTGINEEGHTIKFSAYHQKKAKEGNSDYLSFSSIDSYTRDDDNDEAPSSRMSQLGVSYNPLEDKDIAKKFYKWVYANFSERDADIFIRFYGLDGKKPMSGKELSEKYGVSNCCITLCKKKIIETIKKSKFKEELYSILS